MGMTNGRTICSKHDEIRDLSERILKLADGQKYPDSFTEEEIDALNEHIEESIILQRFLGLLKDDADTIYVLADTAKEDGQSMENGLSYKRERIEELEKEKGELETQVRKLEEEKEDLESKVLSLEEIFQTQKILSGKETTKT